MLATKAKPIDKTEEFSIMVRNRSFKLKADWRLSLVLFFLICSSVFGVSCTPKQIASDITAQIMVSGAPSFEMEPDVEIARTSGLTMIKMIEAFQFDNPKNRKYNMLLARSYANYAQGFWELDMLKAKDTDPEAYQKYFERAKRFYKAGKQYGLQSLTTNSGFKKALTKDLQTYEKSLQSFGRSAVPRLFWTAMNWGSVINLSKDSPVAIIEYPKVEAMMKRVLELDEHYFFSGPHLFFGFSYGSRPKMFGGDPEKSQKHFEEALKAYNREFLLAHVFYAQTYAVQVQDKQLFESLLQEVLAADAAKLPQARLANELAKIRAKWLLAHQDRYFSTSETR